MAQLDIVGGILLLDDIDLFWAKQYRWIVSRRGDVCFQKKIRGRQYVWKFHRELLGIRDPKVHVDHINHNQLDNCRSNLRLCSLEENNRNTRVRATKTSSKYKGVFPCAYSRIHPWRAQIRHENKSYHLGLFTTQEEAAIAYNNKAKELFGEFAWLNPV